MLIQHCAAVSSTQLTRSFIILWPLNFRCMLYVASTCFYPKFAYIAYVYCMYINGTLVAWSAAERLLQKSDDIRQAKGSEYVFRYCKIGNLKGKKSKLTIVYLSRQSESQFRNSLAKFNCKAKFCSIWSERSELRTSSLHVVSPKTESSRNPGRKCGILDRETLSGAYFPVDSKSQSKHAQLAGKTMLS